VFGAGLVMMPRGLGSFAAMFVVGRLVGKIDTRLILITGLCLSSAALLQMSHFDLSMDATPVVTSGVIQGLGIGLIFVPLSVLAFATLTPSLRAEGTSMYTLVRNLGSSVGISIMQAIYANRAAVAHADQAANVQTGSPTLGSLPPAMNPGAPGGLEALNGEVTRQAAMVAYVDVFRLMLIVTLSVMPLLLVMRTPKQASGVEVVVE